MSQTLSLPDLARQVANLEALLHSRPMLHRKDVMNRYGISKSTLHRWVERGIIPRPVRFAGPLWRLADLEASERTRGFPRVSEERTPDQDAL